MHLLYVSALRPWEYADTSTSHKLGSGRVHISAGKSLAAGTFVFV